MCRSAWENPDFNSTACRRRRSTLGIRLSASARVNRFAMPGGLHAGNLDRHRAAARSIEFGQNDALPGAQKHGGIADLEAETLPHDHAAQMRIGVLAFAIGIIWIVVPPRRLAGHQIVEEM